MRFWQKAPGVNELTTNIYRVCCLASYQYPALVFVFLNLVIFRNRHF